MTSIAFIEFRAILEDDYASLIRSNCGIPFSLELLWKRDIFASNSAENCVEDNVRMWPVA